MKLGHVQIDHVCDEFLIKLNSDVSKVGMLLEYYVSQYKLFDSLHCELLESYNIKICSKFWICNM